MSKKLIEPATTKKYNEQSITIMPTLGEIMDSLDAEDDFFFSDLFNSGYLPQNIPIWQRCILDINKLNEKYYLWQLGLLVRPIKSIRHR